MDIRVQAFFLAEADALHRQATARMVMAVTAAMSNKDDRNNFMKSLELDRSHADIIHDNWFMMKHKGKG